MQQDRNNVILCQFTTSLLLLLPMLQPTISTSSEILQLKGPRNTSVETGATAHLRCRLLTSKAPFRKSSIPSSSLTSSSARFVPWRVAENQQVSVQWNIDGFGFTNDSLVETYSGRYIMPGPIGEGQSSPFL